MVKMEPGLSQLKTPSRSGDDRPIPVPKVYIESERERRHRVMIEEGMASIKTIEAEVEKLAKSLRDVPEQIAELQSCTKILFEFVETQRQTIINDMETPAEVVELANDIPSPASDVPPPPEISAAPEAAIVATTTSVTVDGPADEAMDKDADGSEDEDWAQPEVPAQVEMPGKNADEDEVMETAE
jgi:hypothetical protein